MFDHFIAGRKPSWKRRALIIVSLVLHGAAALGLLIWSIFYVEELTPPAVSLTFFSAAPPPPPPPPPPAGRKTVERKPKVPKVVQQPTDIPKLVQPPVEKPEEKDEDSDADGVEGGVPGGVPGGVVGGVVGGVLGAPPPQAPPPKMVASFVLDGQRVSSPDPRLPGAVLSAHPGQQLKGTYRICVRQDGRISEVTVLTPVPGADPAIIEQLKSNWIYKPQPLPVCTIRNFIFIIK